MEPVRVYVGCAANHEDLESQAVLEWSIRKRASLPVDITWMSLSRDPASPFYCDPDTGAGWRTEQWATPFSGFRWAVPELAGWKGRAIYCDSDFIFLADIAELWGQRFTPGRIVMGKGGQEWRLCCSMWDCEEAWGVLPDMDELRQNPAAHRNMRTVLGSGSRFVQAFEGDWNNLDGRDGKRLDDPTLKAIHYTDMSSQPQLAYAIPRLKAQGRTHWYDGRVRAHPRRDVQDLFDDLLREAREQGYNPGRYAERPTLGKAYRKRSFSGRTE